MTVEGIEHSPESTATSSPAKPKATKENRRGLLLAGGFFLLGGAMMYAMPIAMLALLVLGVVMLVLFFQPNLLDRLPKPKPGEPYTEKKGS